MIETLIRKIPSNAQAEQGLLGALLANNKAYERVSDLLLPEHFSDPINGFLYRIIARKIESGQLADTITIRPEIENVPLLAGVGGIQYLSILLTAMVSIINVSDYGFAIYDNWVRRQLIDIGQQIVNSAFGADDQLTANEQIEVAEQSLFQLTNTSRTGGGFVPFEQALILAIDGAERALHQSGGIPGVATGLRDLDAKLGGLHPSDLLILAGRPGMGKTALATKIAFGAATASLRVTSDQKTAAGDSPHVAIFSLEMSAEQLATRLLSEAAKVSSDRIRRGDIGQRDFDRFVQVSRELAILPIQIDDTPAITISALRTRCRRLKRTKGLALVIVDYLQLLRPASGLRAENRVIEIGQITQGLKALAKELAVPVLALSQLSRGVENREDKRPLLSDLRESGTIEQDADCVMFIYRDEYYLEQRMPKETSFQGGHEQFNTAMSEWQAQMAATHNRADLIIAKQRHGPTGTVPLFFEAEYTRFGDLDLGTN